MEGLTRFPPLREEERRPENLFAALFRRGSAGGYLSDADSAGLRRALLRLVQQGQIAGAAVLRPLCLKRRRRS